MLPDIRLNDCVWVRTKNGVDQPVFRPMARALARRGAKVRVVDVASPADREQLQAELWKSDQHVILQGLLPKELSALQPIFEPRKNFSILPIDWWSSPFWYAEHATLNIFHNYNGLMVRSGRAPFMTEEPPWFFWPQRRIAYEIQSALLRPAALRSAPVVDLYKIRQRAALAASGTRCVWFPFPIEEQDVPLNHDQPQYDFASMGATMGTWLMRDPFVPARLNFANLYVDRQRLISQINGFDGRPFKVFDRRRNDTWMPWEELTRIIRQSRFMVCTGGMHRNSITKFLEYPCLGVPMIGTALPYEHPWLDQCMVTVDAMTITPESLKPRLVEAMDTYPKLRQNCLALRDTLLKQYHPEVLLDMLQEQIEGKPIRPGYLKASLPSRLS